LLYQFCDTGKNILNLAVIKQCDDVVLSFLWEQCLRVGTGGRILCMHL